MRIGAFLLAAALGACTGPKATYAPPPTALMPSDPGAIDVDLATVSARTLRQYVDALVLCGSTVPSDWQAAIRELDLMHPFHVFKEDVALIKDFRAGSEPARRELARRGGLLKSMLAFSGPYDKERWDQARTTLLGAGEAGQVLLVTTLLKLLIDGTFRENWHHLRYQLVETGKPAFETSVALLRELVSRAPADKPLFKHDDVVQVLSVVIGFGDAGRPLVQELSVSEKANVRRCVAEAVGETRDVSNVPILLGLLSKDPSWPVRAAAAEACRRMSAARKTVGPALVDRVGKETESYVMHRILRAIADVEYADGVPVLLRATEVPSASTVEAAMQALYVLTGERFRTREQWAAWYRTAYPQWRKKQAP
jgi:hypothetical protein